MRLEAWKTQIGRVRHLIKLAAFRGQGAHASFVYLGKHVRESVLSAVIRQSISELRTTQTLDTQLDPVGSVGLALEWWSPSSSSFLALATVEGLLPPSGQLLLIAFDPLRTFVTSEYWPRTEVLFYLRKFNRSTNLQTHAMSGCADILWESCNG